jgi:hypothetical protein
LNAINPFRALFHSEQDQRIGLSAAQPSLFSLPIVRFSEVPA